MLTEYAAGLVGVIKLDRQAGRTGWLICGTDWGADLAVGDLLRLEVAATQRGHLQGKVR